MMKQSGFTLIELLFTLILTAILAGVVAQIIAGPIQFYFWGARNAELAQMGEQALGFMAKELEVALKGSLRIEKKEHLEIHFRKIQYKGLTGTQESSQKLFIVGKLPTSLFSERELMLYFPLKEGEQLYPVIPKSEGSGDYLIFNQSLPQNSLSQPFYLVSDIRYAWDKKTTLLKREGSAQSILANHVQQCDVEFAKDNPTLLLVSLQLGGRTQSLTLTQPMSVGTP